MLDDLLARNPYPMVATHDPAMVRLTKTLVARHRRDRDTFEFQMLYGVRRDLQDQVVAEELPPAGLPPLRHPVVPLLRSPPRRALANLYFFLSNLVKR